MQESNWKGRCLCGATTWQIEGAPNWQCYCHCDDCRRNCAAPVVAWLGVWSKHFRWTGAEPRAYESTPGTHRYFCATCGTPMAFVAKHYQGEMALYAGTLEEPARFAPTFHVNTESHLPWLALHDDLAKYKGTLLQNS